jgi:transketolase
VLGTAPRIAVEAGVAQPWYAWLGEAGRFVGLSDFGASAPAPKVYEHFGLTTKGVVETARCLLKK